MALFKLVLAPGLNRESTNYGNEGGWYDGDKIRFRSGNPEKIGGWVRLTGETFLGLARALWNWIDLDGTNYVGVGTELKYYIEKGGLYYDITPLRTTLTTTTTNNCFYTANGLNIVSVHITGHGAIQNDFVTFSGATAVGGIPAGTLNSEYQITYVSPDIFLIVVATNATSTVNGGGGTAISAAFQITTGLDVYSSGVGWGAGGWGRGGWGTGAINTVGTQLRLWSNDNYGQDLVLAPRGGAIYYWPDSSGVTSRAKTLSYWSSFYGYDGTYVPTMTNQTLASALQRFVIAFGANPYISGTPNSIFDPMLVRWSDQNNQYQWVPAITNQSGEFRLTHGSYIMAAQITRQETLVWTDSALYSMQYLGPPYVFSFQVMMDNVSIISPNAATTVNNVTYWMGIDKFYFYDGSVHTLPCTLWQYVFEDLNNDQSFQVFSGSNSAYNEVWWFYCSEATSIVDRYVIFNYVDQVWYSGTMERTAWLDSGIRQYPIAANYDSRLLYHEASVDDVSGLTPVPIAAYVQSSDFDIDDGQNFGFVWRILPDVNFNGSDVNNPYVTMTVVPRENAGAPYGSADAPTVTSSDNYALPYPPNSSVYIVQTFTGQVYTRLRGRQMSFRIESDALGVAWQLGKPRIDRKSDGKR